MCNHIHIATLGLFTENIIRVSVCATLCTLVLCRPLSVQPTTFCVCHFIVLEINIEEADYTILEDASNPVIRLQFRRTQSSFTMTIFPVSIIDLNQRFSFNVEDFITIPVIPEALATAGQLLSSKVLCIIMPPSKEWSGML